MSGLFDPVGINRGVSTGDQSEIFGDTEIQVIAAAILNVAGVATLAPNITAQEVTDTLNVLVSSIVDNGDNTYTVTQTDGTSFTFDAEAHDISGDQIINLINALTTTEVIAAARTEATVTRANTGATATVALDTLEIEGTTYRVGGSTPAHARLRTSLTVSPNSIQLPRLGTVIVTGSVSASIENPIAGDVINDVIIHSVHSSYADDRTGSITVVSDTESTFAWNFQVGDPAQVVTFTVSYSISGIIDGQIERSVHNETVTLPIIAEPQHFWTGTVTQAQLNTLTTSLADNELNNILSITRRDNFVSPFTLEYDGGAVGAAPSLYPVLIVDQTILITSLRAEGISLSLSSFNDSTTARTIYTTEGFLSEGPHNLTWRT